MKKDIYEFVETMTSKGMNLELLFGTEVLKLKSLHYGYWEPHQELSLENFKKAQTKYTETLISLLPDTVKTVLDVGCGIGDNALAISKTGREVTAISPDKNHKKFFEQDEMKNINFENADLQNFKTDKKFDLILLSESQSYFSPIDTYKKCQKILNHPGYLLVSDMFNVKENGWTPGVYTKDQYIKTAKDYGLDIVKSIDITKEILPTIKLANNFYKEFFIPSFLIAKTYLKNSSPVKYFLVKTFFKKQLSDLSKIHDYYEKHLDPDFFKKELVYLRLLFKIN